DNPFSTETDITLVLNDWQLDEEGRLITDNFGARHDFSHAGRLGNWLTINGQSMPDIPLKRGRWQRLRLINASTARVLDLAPDRFGAQIIALDGQTFAAPRPVEGVVQLAPAQRMDLVLRPDNTGTLPFEMMTGKPFTFARFVVSDAVDGPGVNRNSEPDAAPLPAASALPEPDLKNARPLPLVMQGGAMGGMRELAQNDNGLSPRELMEAGLFWGLNGMAGMGNEPMLRTRRGETIVFETENNTAFAHAIHIHGHHFRILERNGKPLQHQDFRDTFIAERGEKVKIAFVADNPGKWLIHCHMLGHAASGMMNWFEVA
ncbi:MAG: multicopper oxidase domain-containing protein, partial [Stappiaceae bacterium]